METADSSELLASIYKSTRRSKGDRNLRKPLSISS
jgi:hypothetical protein